jgi:hypothetical protein
MNEQELNAYLLSLAQGCPHAGDPSTCQLQAFRCLPLPQILRKRD